MSADRAGRLRVLLVSLNYEPEQTGFARHVAALAKALVARGHSATVLTAFPFSPQWRRWPEHRGRIWRRQDIGGVEIVRTSHFIPRTPGRLLQRLWMEVSFVLMAVPAIAGARRKPWNAIFYCGAQPTLAMLCRALSWWYRIPYVVSVQDLAARAASDVGMVRPGLLMRAMEAFEHAAYRKAARAIVLCEAFRDDLTARGFPREHVHIVRSPVDVERVRPIAPSGRFRSAVGLDPGDFVVLYAGSMGRKQGLHNVIEAARDPRARLAGIKWVLAGDGELAPAVHDQVDHHGLHGVVTLVPLQPEDGMSEMFASADVLLLNQLSTVKDTVVPSKLLTYMAAGKPILAAVNASSEAARLIGQTGGGLLASPDDPSALAEGALELRRRSRELPAMGRLNRRFAEQHFDQRRIVAVQEDVLSAAVFGERAGGLESDAAVLHRRSAGI